MKTTSTRARETPMGALQLGRPFRVLTGWAAETRPVCSLHEPITGYLLPMGKGLTLGNSQPEVRDRTINLA